MFVLGAIYAINTTGMYSIIAKSVAVRLIFMTYEITNSNNEIAR